MKFSVFIFSLLLSGNIISKELEFNLENDIYSNSLIKFIPHHGSGPYGSYLTMQVNYEVVSKLWKDLEKKIGKKLKNRGEAHVTVITPIEYNEVLKNKISINEIDKIALDYKIQSSSFRVECLGKFGKNISGKLEETFFLVISSEDILKIRKKIAERFYTLGGDKSKFRATHFFPHITVGFSKRDLHESDGAIKDRRSCFASII
ncbi:2'-5' RNA ligase family protein [Halobacteriovorax sp. JY17]|uniref:2'-5' RNA ligase family protein n=1 Tax=Halobacteriovorax sp. JY17 TaxID=2014617 RepID=UPI000C683467|nr:2'-5' RNA ligase family protein [Halobacteriovorax sp. JY17]PIK14867.1 MAG: hypothetical protein CES88_11080 [Halobacteriovorax sp. JY17]